MSQDQPLHEKSSSLSTPDPELANPDKKDEPAADDVPASERQIHGIKWAFCVGAILSSTFLFALDTTVVSHKTSMDRVKPLTSATGC
jgi:hypothetical protein